MSRLSAMRVFALLGSGGLAIVVNKLARSISRSFMAQQGKGSRPSGARQSTLSFSGSTMLGPVNTSMVAALLPQIRPGKARGVKFGGSK